MTAPEARRDGEITAASCGLSVLVAMLAEGGYHFITPSTGAIKWNRAQRRDKPRTLRDIFGWSLPFAESELAPELFQIAACADLLVPAGPGWVSKVRVSSVEGVLFAHSAFPTTAEDAVFLGPDTYRFARMIGDCAGGPCPRRILDLGAGAGVGAVLAAKRHRDALVVASDINPRALRMAAANARAAQVEVQTILSADVPSGGDAYDLIIANPPFIGGDSGRIYRDGGGMAGAQVPLRWGLAAAGRLAPGGRMLLYTGSPVFDGGHALCEALDSGLPHGSFDLDYWEIDPDIFSGMLGAPGYEGVERIAAIGVVISRRS